MRNTPGVRNIQAKTGAGKVKKAREGDTVEKLAERPGFEPEDPVTQVN